MKMKYWIVMAAILIAVNCVQAQFYGSYMGGGSATVDTLVGNVADTTKKFVLYASSRARAGDPCFEFYLTDIGTSTTTDSLQIDLWTTSLDNLDKDGNGWCFVKSYYSYNCACGTLAVNEDFSLVVDTLKYISAKYARLVLAYLGTPAAIDSTKYLIQFTGDKGVEP